MKPPFQYEELTDCALAWQQDDAVLGVPVHWQHEAGGLRLVQVDGESGDDTALLFLELAAVLPDCSDWRYLGTFTVWCYFAFIFSLLDPVINVSTVQRDA